MRSDLRSALRGILARPVSTTVAIASLGVGIGAATAVFTFINAGFIRPVAAHDPGSLAAIYTTDERNPGFGGTSLPNFFDDRDSSRSFEGLAGYRAIPLSLAAGGTPERVDGEIVTSNYFSLLGEPAARGRTFAVEDDRPFDAQPSVVLSHALWKRRFAGDPSAVGRTISVNNHPFTIAGVAPAGFSGLSLLRPAELWIPLTMRRQVLTGVASFIAERRHSGLLQVFGRLRPGATIEGAAAEMRTIAARLEREHPEENKGWGATVLPLTQAVLGPNDRAAYARGAALALGIAALVLLIAGANVANILLARALDRRQEMAVRLALGASRIDIVRLLILENFLVVAAGGGVALFLATWGRDLVLRAGWPMLPPTLAVPIDARVFAFVVAVAAAIGASFGWLPALQGSRPDLRDALAAGSGGAATRRGGGLRAALAAGQVALAAACLVAAGLFLESQLNAGRVDPGFERERMLVASFDLGLQGYDRDRAQAFQERVVDEVSKIPGVTSAAVADRVNLIGGGMLTTAYLEGSAADGLVLRASTVGPGYFDTMGTPLVAGRAFQRSDGEPGPLGWAVVNETLAKKLWPGGEAVGRKFRLANVDETWMVVGVAKDGRYDTITEEPAPHLFMTTLQIPVTDLTLHVRTAVDPARLLEAVRREFRALDPALPLRNVRTMPEVLDQAMWRQKLGTDFTIALAFVALGLAVLGVYGVMSCAVAERRREMGIRVALGARPADLFSLVIARGVRMTLAGLAVGLTFAAAASRWLSGFLFGVEGAGPAALGATALVLLAATLAASYFPAARAARSDPRETLRAE